ncbi:stage III sporulation protein AF [Paenibacillus sp. HJGM_3]|uniref:stage III sporulation protein AF n=1 Tax=Paenibacillus sp. HJGM_3 TaxID=3379816 RepID=UPI0038585589
MIAWLSDWLKQIIIVILLAAFVDLLLPNNALQRYVRTVLGLFILLTLLSPLFTLFQKSLDTRAMLASVEQLPALMDGKGQTGTAVMKPLDAVLEEAGKLKAANEQQTKELVQARVAEEVKSSLETVPGVRVKSVQVDIQTDNNGKPELRIVQAILYPIDGAAGTASDPSQHASGTQGRGMAPVAPVQIQVQVGVTEAGNAVSSASRPLTEAELQAKSQLYELLTQQWQLKRNQIQLNYESEQRKAR